jgi:hypothetical protein
LYDDADDDAADAAALDDNDEEAAAPARVALARAETPPATTWTWRRLLSTSAGQLTRVLASPASPPARPADPVASCKRPKRPKRLAFTTLYLNGHDGDDNNGRRRGRRPQRTTGEDDADQRQQRSHMLGSSIFAGGVFARKRRTKLGRRCAVLHMIF